MNSGPTWRFGCKVQSLLGKVKEGQMRVTKGLTLAAALLVGSGVGGGVVVSDTMANASSTSVTYSACVSKYLGVLYHVDASTTPRCAAGDRLISWDQAGPQGPPGVNGNSVLNGAGAPTSTLGQPGDFYLDTTSDVIYGPKTSTGWPATGTSLVGAQGPQGPQGPVGQTGLQGPQGPQGPAGSGAVYTTATGLTGPALATTGAYSVTVDLSIENYTANDFIGRCGVLTSQQGAPLSTFQSVVSMPANEGGVVVLYGVIPAGLQGRSLMFSGCDPDVADGSTVIPSTATWYVTPIATTTSPQ
jgi:hypothetical protein